MNLSTSIRVKTGYTVLSLVILFVCSIALTPAAHASTPVNVGGKAVVINSDGDTIRVREGAGTQYDQTAEAYEGQTVSILAGPGKDSEGNSWYKVQGPNGTGWIRRDFISGIAGSASPSISKASSATTAKTTSSSTTKKAAQPAPSTPKITGFAKVANTDGDSLRVRNDASQKGSVITTLSPNTVMIVKNGPTVDSANIAWYQVTADGVTGWAMAQYLAQAQPPAQKAVVSQPVSKPASQPASQPAANASRSTTSRGAQPSQPAIVANVAHAANAASAANVANAAQPSTAAGGSRLSSSFVSIAMKYVGSRYRFGGMSPKGFDCSGFVAYIMTKAGKPMSHDMGSQLRSGTRVSTKDLQPGDLLFFSNTYKRGLSHVGIYIGNGRFVHAENESTGVTVSAVWSAYWAAHYTAAVRVK